MEAEKTGSGGREWTAEAENGGGGRKWWWRQKMSGGGRKWSGGGRKQVVEAEDRQWR